MSNNISMSNEIISLREELARAAKERDELQSYLDGMTEQRNDMNDLALGHDAELAALRAKLEQAEKALEPFACGCKDSCDIGNIRHCIHRVATSVLAAIREKDETE